MDDGIVGINWDIKNYVEDFISIVGIIKIKDIRSEDIMIIEDNIV